MSPEYRCPRCGVSVTSDMDPRHTCLDGPVFKKPSAEHQRFLDGSLKAARDRMHRAASGEDEGES